MEPNHMSGCIPSAAGWKEYNTHQYPFICLLFAAFTSLSLLVVVAVVVVVIVVVDVFGRAGGYLEFILYVLPGCL